jgi:probable phosphoglycerate mutase
MRHGESEANFLNLIISHYQLGISQYGLTDNGIKSVEDSIRSFNLLNADTIIYSSDFKRAMETASIVAKEIESIHLLKTDKLRERYFGSFDLSNSSKYEEVWANDSFNSKKDFYGVESVGDVLSRCISLIYQSEIMHKSKNILLVSHGDTLQILLTYFNDLKAYQHRDIQPLNTAEIRKLN